LNEHIPLKKNDEAASCPAFIQLKLPFKRNKPWKEVMPWPDMNISWLFTHL